MAKIIRLTESDLTRIVKRVIRENEKSSRREKFDASGYGMSPFDQSKIDDEEYADKWTNQFRKWSQSDDAKRYQRDYDYWLRTTLPSKELELNPSIDYIEELGIEPFNTKLADEDPEYMREWDRRFMKALKAKNKK